MPIRPVEQADQNQWENLYRDYARFYRRPMSDVILHQVWGWIFDPQMDFHCLVAHGDSGLAALLHFRAMPSPLRGQMIGFADDLFIDPLNRGQGIAERLIDALREHAQLAGWPIVRWITAEDNHRAMAVYDRIGQKTGWQTYEMDCSMNKSSSSGQPGPEAGQAPAQR